MAPQTVDKPKDIVEKTGNYLHSKLFISHLVCRLDRLLNVLRNLYLRRKFKYINLYIESDEDDPMETCDEKTDAKSVETSPLSPEPSKSDQVRSPARTENKGNI